MSSVQVRTAALRAPTINASARLELLEYFLVHHEDLARCAQASLEWLGRHCGVRRAVCLAVDAESSMLVGLAGYGVRGEDVELFSAPILDGEDGLVAALSATRPLQFRTARANGHAVRAVPSTPLGPTTPFTAFPLHGTRPQEQALGLLLLRAPVDVGGDFAWLIGVLGQKMEQIRGRGSIAEELRRLRRERALFYTIINSVTDPILLTDTEGRLIVANARAERLFAATEEESEGRRRAVELNNMLFSAALSRTVVEAPSEARRISMAPV